MTLESGIQSSILRDLESLGKYCECFKIMKANGNGEPDVFFTTCVSGAVLVEVKRPTGSEQKLQSKKIEKLNNCGTKAFVCYSWKEWVELKKLLHLNIESVQLAHQLAHQKLQY